METPFSIEPSLPYTLFNRIVFPFNDMPQMALFSSLLMGEGNSLAFDHDLTDYTALSQIRLYPQLPADQVGPLLLATFEITKSASISGGILDKLSLYLPSSVTADLPRTAYWDLQLTDNTTGHVKTYLQGKIFTKAQVTTTNGDFHV
jgi:hypothetical protein